MGTRSVCLVDGTLRCAGPTRITRAVKPPTRHDRVQHPVALPAQRRRHLYFRLLPSCTHDAKAFATTPVAEIVQNSGDGIGDKGYQRRDIITPRKTPPGGELSRGDKANNTTISALRAPVERLVAHFKSWRIFHTDYRRPYRTYRDTYDAARGLFFFSITWVLNDVHCGSRR